MEVEVLHGDHLGIASSGGAPFDSKGGALRRLADDGGHALSQSAQGLRKTHGSGGLAFAQRRRGDGGDVDVFSIGTFRQAFQDLQTHLGLVWSVELKLLVADAQFACHVGDGAGDLRLGDIKVGWNGLHKNLPKCAISQLYSLTGESVGEVLSLLGS